MLLWLFLTEVVILLAAFAVFFRQSRLFKFDMRLPGVLIWLLGCVGALVAFAGIWQCTDGRPGWPGLMTAFGVIFILMAAIVIVGLIMTPMNTSVAYHPAGEDRPVIMPGGNDGPRVD